MGIEQKRYQSLSEFLFDQIAENILDGKYRPGQKLVENDIQEEFGVSKSPAREALQMLTSYGIVEYRPRRGCYVKGISVKDVEDHFLVRIALEGIAAQAAYEETSAGDHGELQAIYDEMAAHARKRAERDYLRSHDAFHAYFAQKSGNGLLVELSEKLRVQNTRYRLQFLNMDVQDDFHTHDEILHHFRLRDLEPEGVRALMETHIRAGLILFRRVHAHAHPHT